MNLPERLMANLIEERGLSEKEAKCVVWNRMGFSDEEIAKKLNMETHRVSAKITELEDDRSSD